MCRKKKWRQGQRKLKLYRVEKGPGAVWAAVPFFDMMVKKTLRTTANRIREFSRK